MPTQLTRRLRLLISRAHDPVSAKRWLRLPQRDESDPAVKPAPYLQIYEQLLAPLRRARFTLLELGVWGGDSLEMWRDAFSAATIIGVDVRPPDINLGPRVHIVEGDQADRGLMAGLRSTYAPSGFDVIVDDASHLGVTSARSLQVLFREHLRPGGLYCIEDWGTGYLRDWPDGGPAHKLDVADLDAPTHRAAQPDAPSTKFPSHQLGMVGLIKRLVDHTAAGTIEYGQPGQVAEALDIERMIVWDGIVALYKPRDPG
jgi:hypothetical protein